MLVGSTVVDLARKSEKALTSGTLEGAAISADHHALAVVTGGAVTIFALPSLAPKTTLSIHGGRASALSNDATLFATKTKEGVEVFDVATSKRIAPTTEALRLDAIRGLEHLVRPRAGVRGLIPGLRFRLVACRTIG